MNKEKEMIIDERTYSQTNDILRHIKIIYSLTFNEL